MTIPYNYLVVEQGGMALYLDKLKWTEELTLFAAFSEGAGFDWRERLSSITPLLIAKKLWIFF